MLSRLKRLPCARFYVEQRGDVVNEHITSLLGPGEEKEAMLRTQQTLVISAVSSRWFVVDVVRPMRLLVGATIEGQERLQPTALGRRML